MTSQNRKVCRTYGRHRLRKFCFTPDRCFNPSDCPDPVSAEITKENLSVLCTSQKSSDNDFFALLSKSLTHYEPKQQNSCSLDSSSLSEAIDTSNHSSGLFKSFSKLHKNVEDFRYYKENRVERPVINVKKVAVKKKSAKRKAKISRKNKHLKQETETSQAIDVDQQMIDWNEIEQYSFVLEKCKTKASHQKEIMGLNNSNFEVLSSYRKHTSGINENSVPELSSVVFPKIASADPSPIYKDTFRGMQCSKLLEESPNLRLSQNVLRKNFSAALKNHNIKTSTPFFSRGANKGKRCFTGISEQLSMGLQKNLVESPFTSNLKTMGKVIQTPTASKCKDASEISNGSWQSQPACGDSYNGSVSLFQSKSIKNSNFSSNRVTHRRHIGSDLLETSGLNFDLSAELFSNQSLQMPNFARVGSLDMVKRLTAVGKSCLEKLSYICQSSRVSKTCAIGEGSYICKPCKLVVTPLHSIRSETPIRVDYSPEKQVLDICSQNGPIKFCVAFDAVVLDNCVKIGEGVYGEVFRLHQKDGANSALKIIPIEGNFNVNDETQKSFSEILPEIIITKKLSDLRKTSYNCTSNFINIKKILYLRGKYPSQLLEEWNKYNIIKESLNDNPEIFQDDQLYIALECADGGVDLENAQLKNAGQAVSIFTQVACCLAVAEQAVQFEHRDLHWGNILVSQTERDVVEYTINGQCFSAPTNGVLASVIDFTLSRLGKDGHVVFTDLSQDPSLFTGEGDYQFDIYRKVKDINENNWEKFLPFSNILWLHYLSSKLYSEKEYKNKTSKKHKSAKQQLLNWKSSLLKYESATDFISKSGIISFDSAVLENKKAFIGQKREAEACDISNKLTYQKTVNHTDETEPRKSSFISSKKLSINMDIRNVATKVRTIRGSIRKGKKTNKLNYVNLKAYNVRI